MIPGSERSPGEGNGNPLQYSFPGNPMDRGAWWATVRGVAKTKQLNNNDDDEEGKELRDSRHQIPWASKCTFRCCKSGPWSWSAAVEGVGGRARVSSEELTEAGSRSPALSLLTQLLPRWLPVFHEHKPGLLPPPPLLWLLFCTETFPLEIHQLPPSPHSCFSNFTCPDHRTRAVPASSLYFPVSCLIVFLSVVTHNYPTWGVVCLLIKPTLLVFNLRLRM